VSTASASPPSAEAVRASLLGVIDPELGDNIVDLGMVRAVEVEPDGRVEVTIALTTAGCPMRAQLRDDTLHRVGSLPGVTNVRVHYGEMTRKEKAALMDRARRKAQEGAPETDIPALCRIVAIASGKGGVGKSSVTANLAAALANRGFTVGVLDADIWGFSIPRMLGVEGQMPASGTRDDWQLTPLERKVGPGLLRVVSMGFLAEEQEAIMWRGLILNRALQHFVEDVRWGDIDYLLIDLPPGTGDIQMGLARMLPRTEMLIVTTPALAAQKVASRATDMARKGHLRVAGVIENMTAFVCDHGESYALFGEGGGQRLADEAGVPLLGSIPLEPSVAAGGDVGSPVALGNGPAAEAFAALAERIAVDVIPVVKMEDCTARLFAAVAAAEQPA
jgi:ATP-binding protein involved in chromosome partitioning